MDRVISLRFRERQGIGSVVFVCEENMKRRIYKSDISTRSVNRVMFNGKEYTVVTKSMTSVRIVRDGEDIIVPIGAVRDISVPEFTGAEAETPEVM